MPYRHFEWTPMSRPRGRGAPPVFDEKASSSLLARSATRCRLSTATTQFYPLSTMKKILVTLFSLISVSVALAADVNITGVWKVDSETAGTTSTSLIPFKQDGTKLTGTMKSPEGKDMTVTGKVEGKKVTWTFVSEWEGNALTVTYVGTLDDTGASMKGTNDVQPMGIEGAFIATKQEGAPKEAAKKEEPKKDSK